MVEISMSGSGEGPVWVTGRGYSTKNIPYKAQEIPTWVSFSQALHASFCLRFILKNVSIRRIM